MEVIVLYYKGMEIFWQISETNVSPPSDWWIEVGANGARKAVKFQLKQTHGNSKSWKNKNILNLREIDMYLFLMEK